MKSLNTPSNEYIEFIVNYIQNIEVLETYINGLDDILSHQTEKLLSGEAQHDSVRPLFKSLFTFLAEAQENSNGNMEDFEEKFEHGILSFYEEKLSVQIEDRSVAKRFQKASNQLALTFQQIPMIYSSSLINLAIYFELLATQLIQKRLMDNPEAAKIEKKSLTLTQIEELGSLEEAKNYLIEQEVVDLMHNGFKSWLGYFEDRMKVDISKIKPYTEKVNEVFCRRHLFVHNGGTVNNIYLTRVSKECREGITLGDDLSIDPEYFDNTLKLFKLYGIVLALETWKRKEKESEERTDFLLVYIYDLLIKEEWAVARILCQFIMDDKNVPAKKKWTANINYWLTRKELGEYSEIEDEIKNTDLSALSGEFQLCKMALLDNYAGFFDLLEDNFPKPIGLEDLEEWPIFKEIRNQETYTDFINERKVPSELIRQ
ncbi:hypothetical protein [Rossellomorea marisflavi]|uniref:hypothetical protein n=1 Tax=Rossellomorea marisflavi TaxID=189381 RepID=UPI003D2F0B30